MTNASFSSPPSSSELVGAARVLRRPAFSRYLVVAELRGVWLPLEHFPHDESGAQAAEERATAWLVQARRLDTMTPERWRAELHAAAWLLRARHGLELEVHDAGVTNPDAGDAWARVYLNPWRPGALELEAVRYGGRFHANLNGSHRHAGRLGSAETLEGFADLLSAADTLHRLE